MTKPLPSIYMASKTKHAKTWRQLRTMGFNIISTWIDEAEPGQTKDHADLWLRCLNEAADADYLIVFRESDEILKGGWVEVGAALASNVPVLAIGCEEFTIGKSGFLQHHASVFDALKEIHPKSEDDGPDSFVISPSYSPVPLNIERTKT